MAAVTDFVSVAVTVSSAAPSVPGFSKSLVLVNKVPVTFSGVRTYTDPSQPISDGFLTSDDAYLAITAAFSANPRPSSVMVAKRANKTSQSARFTVAQAIVGDTFFLNLVSPTGVQTTISYVVPAGSPTVTTIATAILALITTVTGFSSATSAAGVITIPGPSAGVLNGFNTWSTNLQFADASADPGIAADLAAARLIDDTWYGFDIDSHSKAEILAAASWAEANKKLFVTSSADEGVADQTVTTDVGTAIQAASYHYTGLLFSGQNTKSYAGFEWQAVRFGASPTPGNDTWMFNELPGVTIDPLTETQNATLAAKNVTGYQNVGGRNMTAAGGIANTKSCGMSGSGEFLDQRRFLDWQISQLEIALFGAISNGGIKVPYTDKGMVTLFNAESGALGMGVTAGGFAPGSIEVAQPLVSSQAPADRAARIVRNLNWSADLAGGVHMVQGGGSVSI